MQGEAFDWHSHMHRTLDSQVLAVLDTTYSFGICRRHCIKAKLWSPLPARLLYWILLSQFWDLPLKAAEGRIAGRNHTAMLLSLKGSCRYDAPLT